MNITSAHFLPGTNKKLGDKYLLLECLGDGTHGWVWRAERLADNSVVAVKIPKDLTKEDRQLAEGKELLRVDPHPNIVRITDMGRIPPENEWFFIEMEYFPSQSLAQRLDQRRHHFGDTFEHLFKIYSQVLDAVHFLAGVTPPISHGDIKPHNILVGAGDHVKLTDFGSSALPDEIYVRTRENGGTVLYAAPEFSDSVSRKGTFRELVRGDIYSLGVLLYQLLTGQLPHDTPAQVRRHAPFRQPSEINSSVHPAIERVVLRCLKKDPADRFQSIEELQSAFAKARIQQLASPTAQIAVVSPSPAQDWSTAVLSAIEQREYLKAARLAGAEYARSSDLGALLQQLNAYYRAEPKRLEDFRTCFESQQDVVNASAEPEAATIRMLAIKIYLLWRSLDKAKELLTIAEERDGGSLDLVFLEASLYGLDADFKAARAALERINRATPSRPEVLSRLVQVCEQMRDFAAAIGYLRHALRISGDAPALVAKRLRYQGLGMW
ncbi:protein kinase domain-containing protein [Paraburkholderia sediminicola]|uniref:protein kinase domain-containing protein n=1 Tax=Paraburkholderia sediminicola TaxID=458836 RepID=UPI0038B81626